MEYNFSNKDVSKEVIVTYDKSIITKKKKSKKEIEQDIKEHRLEKIDKISNKQLANFGMESALGKEERIFKLKAGIDKSEYVTLTSASKGLNVSRETIKTYLKELNKDLHNREPYTLFDDTVKKWI